MIKDPSELIDSNKRIKVLVAGYPGIGKSTLGLSAPRPLHIDVDFGASRIEARYRKPLIQPKSYQEVLDDLASTQMDDFDTLVFDTGGKLIDLMKPWAIKNDPKNGKRDGSLSLQGYGTVGREFVRLMDYCFYELDKNVVVLFHAVEEKDGDSTRLRLMVEGQTKNNVWIPMDLGGFMEIVGNDRTMGFSNCERYYAKGTRGINGLRKIPPLDEKTPNDFLTKLFEEYNARDAHDMEAALKQKEEYGKVMGQGLAAINAINCAEDANGAVAKMKELKHVLTSEAELKDAFHKRVTELGLVLDKESKTYSDPAPAKEEPAADEV